MSIQKYESLFRSASSTPMEVRAYKTPPDAARGLTRSSGERSDLHDASRHGRYRTAGAPLAALLLERFGAVRCLVRDAAVGKALAPGAQIAPGDVTDPDSLRAAVSGCTHVFHAAGIPGGAAKNNADYRRVNVEGTCNLLAAAVREEGEAFVYTSTIDIFDRTRPGYDETTRNPGDNLSAYERSKIEAQALVDAHADRLSVRSVCSSAIYGPGGRKPTGLTAALWALRRGRMKALPPGGLPVVFNADLARAQIAALEKGGNGGRYIVSDRFLGFTDMALQIQRLYPDVRLPKTIPTLIANAAVALAPVLRALGREPPITDEMLRMFTRYPEPSSALARRELSWPPTPFTEGVRQTFASRP